MRLAKIWALGGDFEQVGGQLDFDRIGLFRANQLRTMDTLQEQLSLQLQPLVRLLGDDLLVVRIIALDDFGVEIDMVNQSARIFVGRNLKRSMIKLGPLAVSTPHSMDPSVVF